MATGNLVLDKIVGLRIIHLNFLIIKKYIKTGKCICTCFVSFQKVYVSKFKLQNSGIIRKFFRVTTHCIPLQIQRQNFENISDSNGAQTKKYFKTVFFNMYKNGINDFLSHLNNETCGNDSHI